MQSLTSSRCACELDGVQINYSEANAVIWNDVRLTALGLSNFLMTYNTPFINVDEGTTFGAVVGSVVWDMVNKVPNVTFASTVQTWAYEKSHPRRGG